MQSEFTSWDKLTVITFRDTLLELIESQIASSTAALYRQVLTKLSTIIGDIRLGRIQPYHIELFKSKRLKMVSAIKVNIDYRTLKAAFNRALQMGMIDENPFLKCRNVVVPEKEPAFLTREQFDRLIRFVPDPRFRSIIVIAASTGMRAGELINLRWEDIDFHSGFIRLRNRPDFILKGKRGRSIPLNKTAVREITQMPCDSEFVFHKEKQLKLPVASISRKFKKIIRKAGLPEEIHFHSLRHSYATWLIQQKVPASYVQRFLGHSNISTTMIYAHADEFTMRESAKGIDAYLMN
jgi:integrase/recombinase XerC